MMQAQPWTGPTISTEKTVKGQLKNRAGCQGAVFQRSPKSWECLGDFEVTFARRVKQQTTAENLIASSFTTHNRAHQVEPDFLTGTTLKDI